MPKQYDQEAIDTCRKLYCKYGGKNLDRVEKEMREVYPGWLKQTLFNRGKDDNFREGWIEKYGFDKSLREYLKTQIEGVTDDVQKLYLGIKSVRETLEKKVTTNPDATRDDIYSYRDFCKLEMDARQKLDLEKDNYESFVACFEKQLAWLPEIDEKAAAAFLSGDVAERLLARARLEYGEQENKSVS